MLSDRAIQIIADNKIRAAIEAGEFDNLPGLGQPAAIFDEPYDPHWWIRRKLKREGLTAVQIEARCLGYTAGTTQQDIVEHYKENLDRTELCENLELNVDERFQKFKDKMLARARHESCTVGC
jgi:Domain of unknown function (DUF1992)